jgi:uncharacterized membrane protein HdeD (DUF308 family)
LSGPKAPATPVSTAAGTAAGPVPDDGGPAGQADRVPPGALAATRPTGGRLALAALGFLIILYGLLVMSFRPTAITVLVAFVGIGFFATGLAQFGLAAGVGGSRRWLAAVGGVVGIAAGVTTFLWPGLTLVLLAVVTAWALVLGGTLRVVDAVSNRERDLWWLGLLAGVAELLLGLWAIGTPGGELLVLVNLVGIYLVITGLDAAVAAFADRAPAPRGATTGS